jgi:O-antigen/teichoic acid export membrane protein
MSLSSRYVGNAIANLMGGVFPALATIATIPYIVAHLGDSAYGVLVLVTSIMGYFALIDINVTAGSVKFVAEHHARGDHQKVHQVITFGLWVYLAIGLIGMIGLWGGAQLMIEHLFKIPPELQPQAAGALRWAALGFLLGQLQTYLQSVPQSLQRYDISGRIEAVFGMLVPVLTVVLLAMGMGLVEVVILRVVASLFHGLSLVVAIKRLMPDFKLEKPSSEVRHGVLSFSAFSFLSRLASLTYTHADKLLIGAMVSVQQVTYFAVASTVANRVLSLTARLSSVIFPVASALAASREMKQLESVYLQASRYMFFINGAAVVLLACFAEPILRLWMGAEFAKHGALIMAVVALSQFVDSLTNIPSLVNDGLGHPRVSGLFAVTRALLGLALLYVGVAWLQADGAAWAHFVASVIMTAVFVLYVHGRTVPIALSHVVRQSFSAPGAVLCVGAVVALALNALEHGSILSLVMTVGISALTISVGGWFWVLSAEHRQQIAARWPGKA